MFVGYIESDIQFLFFTYVVNYYIKKLINNDADFLGMIGSDPNLENSGKDCSNLIAYFSMEIGLEEAIPTYSGGLGILAGDSLKSFADIGIDVVAITLLSEKGYFYQKLDDSGYQHEEDNIWPVSDFMNKLDKEVELKINGRSVFVGAWEYFITRTSGKKNRILFLDTNLDKNSEDDRKLTSYLYGGDLNYRLEQEMILGLGGVRMLHELGYAPRKYHMNEGHAAFLTLELFNNAKGSFDEKIKSTRILCSFTTHTPVPAGHDSFDENKVAQYLGNVLDNQLKTKVCADGKFSMSILALTLASYVNAVSKKHREVSKSMFPDFEIDYITNGVHANTWMNTHLASVLDKYIPDWRKNPLNLRNALRMSNAEMLSVHNLAKRDLINHVNNHKNAGFDYDMFTIGFARRVTGYKRANLIFRDIERLKKISSSSKGIQIIFAGKAHPRDEEGKQIIKQIYSVINTLKKKINIIFIENYNMHVAELMVSGVDLWLNTPKRPLEASGTSGMKAAINGVPSLSVPDGWWVEGCIEGITGWSIGKEITTKSADKIDEEDAKDMYDKLEKVIIPMFYNSKEKYAEVMKNCIAINGAYFNTMRMAKQYLVRAYARNNK